MKFKKIILPIIIGVVLIGLSILLYYIVDSNSTAVDTGKSIFELQKDEITFTGYDRINKGEYFFLYDGINTSLVDSEFNLLEGSTSKPVYFMKYFNSDEYSDYYYVLDSEFIIKKDGKELSTIKYNALDFDLRKSTVKVYMLDNENILLTNDSTETKDGNNTIITYAYVYNLSKKQLYSKFSSYNGLGIVDNNTNSTLLIKDKNGYYDMYDTNNHKRVFNKYYAKIGNLDVDNNTTKSLSKLYMYVCSNVSNGIYDTCGLIDYDNSVRLTLKYDDNSIFDYNDKYYVLKKGSSMVLYDYNNVTKLSDYEYIMLSNNYIITFKNEIMDIYNYELKKLKSTDIHLITIVGRDTKDTSKNIDIIDNNDIIIVNLYDNYNIDLGKTEDTTKVRSYVYGTDIYEEFDGRRIYKKSYYNGELMLYYSPLYIDDSISKIFLYNEDFVAFRVINLDNNLGDLKIIDKCDDLSIGYILDNNYIIYNPNFESSGVEYPNEVKYNNSICNSSGNYNSNNTALYNKSKSKITFNQILNLTQTKSGNYLIIYDDNIGLFKLKES